MVKEIVEQILPTRMVGSYPRPRWIGWHFCVGNAWRNDLARMVARRGELVGRSC